MEHLYHSLPTIDQETLQKKGQNVCEDQHETVSPGQDRTVAINSQQLLLLVQQQTSKNSSMERRKAGELFPLPEEPLKADGFQRVKSIFFNDVSLSILTTLWGGFHSQEQLASTKWVPCYSMLFVVVGLAWFAVIFLRGLLFCFVSERE